MTRVDTGQSILFPFRGGSSHTESHLVAYDLVKVDRSNPNAFDNRLHAVTPFIGAEAVACVAILAEKLGNDGQAFEMAHWAIDQMLKESEQN